MELKIDQSLEPVQARICGEIYSSLFTKLRDFHTFHKSVQIIFYSRERVAVVLILADRHIYLESEEKYQSQRFSIGFSGEWIVEQFLHHLGMRLVRSQSQGRLSSPIDIELLQYLVVGTTSTMY